MSSSRANNNNTNNSHINIGNESSSAGGKTGNSESKRRRPDLRSKEPYYISQKDLTKLTSECEICNQSVACIRYASHLRRCMGLGRPEARRQKAKGDTPAAVSNKPKDKTNDPFYISEKDIAKLTSECEICNQSVACIRYASHLRNCMGLGRVTRQTGKLNKSKGRTKPNTN